MLESLNDLEQEINKLSQTVSNMKVEVNNLPRVRHANHT
jgi:hypothetical protein